MVLGRRPQGQDAIAVNPKHKHNRRTSAALLVAGAKQPRDKQFLEKNDRVAYAEPFH